MNNEENRLHSVTYENTFSHDPVTADEINVQAVAKNRKNTDTESERDCHLNFFDGMIPSGTSPYFEDGVLKQGVPCNGACESSAPYIEEILADEQLRTHQTTGIDPYSPQPAYNPWYKPFAKRAQQQPTRVHERPKLVTTYQIRSHNSWSHGKCLGTFLAIVIFVGLFVYVIMGLNGRFRGSLWNRLLE